MIDTYKTYLAADRSLTLEEMEQLHGDIISEMGNDPDALELYQELAVTATRYIAFRSQWFLWSRATPYFTSKNVTVQTAHLLDRKRRVKKHRMSIRCENWRGNPLISELDAAYRANFLAV